MKMLKYIIFINYVFLFLCRYTNVYGIDTSLNATESLEDELRPLSPSYRKFIRGTSYFDEELPPVEERTVRFVSYNILASFFTNRGDPVYFTHTSWINRCTPLLDLFEKINPSIINLQEVSIEQFHDILRGLNARQKNYAGVGHIPGTRKELSEVSTTDYPAYKNFTVVTLYDTTVWNLEKNGIFWLKDNPDEPPLDESPFTIDITIESNIRPVDTDRGVEWSILTPKHKSLPSSLKLLVLNSHFSVARPRSKCVELVLTMLLEGYYLNQQAL